ncbi:hypothetical protein PoB_000502500 [Plakobranchus ocellatus]|uniref:Uncharacterized protein n=1 Tax=Plakobranchus ocellatus TaxID=259542 RepID=A0AAV3Y7Q6_9GAST|nr:hypothetical protein PoB_000502500 [Plakobranchus ocellatus]
MVNQDHLTKFCVLFLRSIKSKRPVEVASHLLDIFVLLGNEAFIGLTTSTLPREILANLESEEDLARLDLPQSASISDADNLTADASLTAADSAWATVIIDHATAIAASSTEISQLIMKLHLTLMAHRQTLSKQIPSPLPLAHPQQQLILSNCR